MFDGLEMGIHPMVAHPALQEFYRTGSAANPAAFANVVEKDYIGFWNGRITALFLLGAAAGGFIFGWLGDKIGRVKAMSLSILFYSGFTGLCYFAGDPLQMGGLRFLAALGMGGEWSLGVALVMEAWPNHLRPLLAGLIGAASNVGFMLIALFGWFYPVTQDSWRTVLLVGALPAVLTFFIRLFVPESEKWQAAVAQEATVRPAREILQQPWLGRTLLAIGLASVVLIGTWGAVQNIPTWVSTQTEDRVEERNNLHHYFIMQKYRHLILADENDSEYQQYEADVAAVNEAYSIHKKQISKNRALSQICSALGAVTGCLMGPLLGWWFNRRFAYMFLCVTSLVTCLILYSSYPSITEFDWRLFGLIFLVGMSTAAFYGWLPLYLPELFPTRIRATGQGIAFNFGRVLAAAGAIYSGQLVQQYGWAGMGAAISLVYLVGIVLILFAPETKGRPLPE